MLLYLLLLWLLVLVLVWLLVCMLLIRVLLLLLASQRSVVVRGRISLTLRATKAVGRVQTAFPCNKRNILSEGRID
jgi:hypothetical protein